MTRRNLIATKDFSYSTRRLRAGDLIENVPHADARVLIAIGKAREAREPGEVPAPPSELVEAAKVATPQKPTEQRDPAPTKKRASTGTRAASKKATARRSPRKRPSK